jgi:DinB superfamily
MPAARSGAKRRPGEMGPQAQALWDSLEFRTPAVLRAIEPLSDEQLQWGPPNGANSIAWLLWHIAEVEDNWVRDRILGLPKRFPFGASVKARADGAWPNKTDLVAYFREVRAISRRRLEETAEDEFDRRVIDDHFGEITVRRLWSGVATSGAWHGGQIVLIANRLVPRP